MSAQEWQQHDDEERDRRQESGRHSDPNRPPLVGGRRRERRHPGNEPGQPDAAPAPDEDEHGRTREQRAAKRKHGTLEDGSAFPGRPGARRSSS